MANFLVGNTHCAPNTLFHAMADTGNILIYEVYRAGKPSGDVRITLITDNPHIEDLHADLRSSGGKSMVTRQAFLNTISSQIPTNFPKEAKRPTDNTMLLTIDLIDNILTVKLNSVDATKGKNQESLSLTAKINNIQAYYIQKVLVAMEQDNILSLPTSTPESESNNI